MIKKILIVFNSRVWALYLNRVELRDYSSNIRLDPSFNINRLMFFLFKFILHNTILFAFFEI